MDIQPVREPKKEYPTIGVAKSENKGRCFRLLRIRIAD